MGCEMIQKKKSVVVTLLLILSITLLFTIFKLTIYKDRIEMARNSISLGTIQHNLALVGLEISNQEKNQWDSAEKIMLYVQNVNNGIGVTLQTTQELDAISSQELETLNRLYDLLDRYLYPMPTGKLELTDIQKNELVVLRDHLKENGWGGNIGYSGDWNDFMKRTNHFLNSDFVPQIPDAN